MTKAEVIARTAEILDISLCRRPLKVEHDGEPVFLKTPNLAIAARMVEKLGDATNAWQSGDSGRPAAAMNVGTLIMDGGGGGSLVDAMIERIRPGSTIEHQPEGDRDGETKLEG